MKRGVGMLIAGAALGFAATAASAHSNIGFSVSLGVPAYAAPPVYYAPPPVYYAQPPVYYAPPPVYYGPPRVYYGPPAYYGRPRHWRGHGYYEGHRGRW